MVTSGKEHSPALHAEDLRRLQVDHHQRRCPDKIFGRVEWRNAGDDKSQPGYQITDRYSEIAVATLPRDRWGALGLFPDKSEGSVWSAPGTSEWPRRCVRSTGM